MDSTELRIRDTSVGTVELDHDGIVVVRFDESLPVKSAAISETLSARLDLSGGVKRPTMIVLHPNFDLHSYLPKIDRNSIVEPFTLCEAVVTRSSANENASRLYYRYFNPPFACDVFRDEKAAREWLLSHL